MNPFRRALLVIACLAVLAPCAANATIYVVYPNGSGPFATIQDAINSPLVVAGDVIELANGTFGGPGNFLIDYLGKAITIRSQNGAANCTINPGGLARGFLFHSGEGPQSVLDGVTITDGYDVFGGGGAIQAESSPLVRNCVITACTSGFYHDDPGLGGGVYCGVNSAAQFIGCTISGNSASGLPGWGGGAYVAGNASFQDCVFSGNRTWAVGGGLAAGGNLACDASSRPTFLNCTFSSGQASAGGGIYCSQSSANFTGCTISDNVAGGGGGAFCYYSFDTFDHCILVGNGATNRAGGVECFQAPVVLQNCTLYGNQSVSGAGGIELDADGSLVTSITSTIVSFSSQGQAIVCGPGSTATLSCCDLYGNAGGDWVGCAAGQQGGNGNISLDPLFCDAATRDFHLHGNSPCLPSGGCTLIGALGLGCGSTAVREATWGSVKTLFR